MEFMVMKDVYKWIRKNTIKNTINNWYETSQKRSEIYQIFSIITTSILYTIEDASGRIIKVSIISLYHNC